VLIELHGGGFAGCPRTCGQIESIPIAGLGGFTVVRSITGKAPNTASPPRAKTSPLFTARY